MIPLTAPTTALLNPGLLFLGAGLVAVPILIHLLNRRRVQHVSWAAMQWLLTAMRRHQRRLRLENWLILLLRIAAVLLLGLALARPVLTDPDLAGLLSGKQNVYLVIDTSYSMSARSQGHAVMDVAKAEADAVLSDLGGDDTVAVVVTNDPRRAQSDGRAPFVLIPRTVGQEGISAAKEAVASLPTRDTPADQASALARIRQQTAKEDVNRLVIVITDLQSRDWREDRVGQALADLLALPAAVRVLDVGGKDRQNLTVAAVKSATLRDAFVDRPLHLDVTVENQGMAPVENATVSVFLDANPTPVVTRNVPSLDAADAQTGQPGSARLRFTLPGSTFPKPGSHVLKVEVTPPHDDPAADALGLDSRRGFALRVRDRIRVLAWTRTSRGAHLHAASYLRGVYERWEVDASGKRIRERSPLYEMHTVPSEAVLVEALERGGDGAVDLVVLANVGPRGRAVDALRSFVRGGGALLVFVGDRIPDEAVLNDAFYANADTRLLPYPYGGREVRKPDATPFTFDLETDTGHPLAQPFTGEDAAAWIGLLPPSVWGRMPFREDVPPSATPNGTPPSAARDGEGDVVLRFKDGLPAIVAGSYGLGKTLWVATSLDHGWFERAFFFLPVFLDEAAVLATRPDDARRNLEVGRRIVVNWLPRDATDVRFIAPGGAEVVPTRYDGLGEADRPMFVVDTVGTAGTWRLVYEREGLRGERERMEERFAVNPDPGEGRIRRARDGDLTGAVPQESDLLVFDSWSEGRALGGEVHQGEISFLLLWIALGLLLLESLLAWMFGRRHRTAASHAEARG